MQAAYEEEKHHWDEEKEALSIKMEAVVAAMKEQDNEIVTSRERVNADRGMESWDYDDSSDDIDDDMSSDDSDDYESINGNDDDESSNDSDDDDDDDDDEDDEDDEEDEEETGGRVSARAQLDAYMQVTKKMGEQWPPATYATALPDQPRPQHEIKWPKNSPIPGAEAIAKYRKAVAKAIRRGEDLPAPRRALSPFLFALAKQPELVMEDYDTADYVEGMGE